MKLATLVLILEGNKILLGRKKRGIGAGNLNSPGGKMEEGETLEECAVRETREEMGVHLDKDSLEKVAVVTFFVSGDPMFECHVFRAMSHSGTPLETEEMAPEWYELSSLPLEKMHEGDRAWFLRAAQGERFKANVYYRGKGEGLERVEFETL